MREQRTRPGQACATRTPTCTTRAILDRVGAQWSFLVILLLEDGSLRFGELKAKAEGISLEF